MSLKFLEIHTYFVITIIIIYSLLDVIKSNLSISDSIVTKDILWLS